LGLVAHPGTKVRRQWQRCGWKMSLAEHLGENFADEKIGSSSNRSE